MFLKNTLIGLFWINIIAPYLLLAQMPNTDIWLVKLSKKNKQLVCEKPINITNRVGYDNQPFFSENGKEIYYSSVREDHQSDIYAYSISKKKSIQLTKTTESEYSPSISADGNYLSTVVVLADSSQKIMKYDIKTVTKRALVSETDSVGYYTWLNNDSIIYYKLTEPHSLHVLDLKTEKDTWICNNPSRTFKRMGTTSQFIYAVKDSTELIFWIYNPTLREAVFYTKHSSLQEDFTWDKNYGLIKAHQNTLIRYDEAQNKWEKLIDLSSFGLNSILRFGFNSQFSYLAIVCNQ